MTSISAHPTFSLTEYVWDLKLTVTGGCVPPPESARCPRRARPRTNRTKPSRRGRNAIADLPEFDALRNQLSCWRRAAAARRGSVHDLEPGDRVLPLRIFDDQVPHIADRPLHAEERPELLQLRAPGVVGVR